MEFVLRCNDLKCRADLNDRAVVTTCSHVFCPQCADASGLSRAPNAARQCPACGTQLVNPDDVVVSGLNLSEDYKTSILGALSPTIIMECASRGLQLYSYQASQEIIFQEHLAKTLTEKYANLSQQMDQLIHDANAQIKVLQDKVQALQAEQVSLEQKNHELQEAFREKSRSQQQVQKLYQSLKAQVMSSHVANAAGEEADFALQSARSDRFVNQIPGMRTGAANFGPIAGSMQHGDRGQHNRYASGSSGSGRQQRGGVQDGSAWSGRSQAVALNGRMYNGQPIPLGTPSGAQTRSRLPVLGGYRPKSFLGVGHAPTYQPSPIPRQQVGAENRRLGSFGLLNTSKRAGGPNEVGSLSR